MSEINAWAGDLIDEDDPDLVDQLRLQVLPRRGIFASADEVMVTIGSQQALSLLIQLLVGRNTPAGVEDPCYPDTRNMLTLATDDLATLAIDRQGVVPDATFASRRVAFVTVGHQCPTTAVMPLERRRALLEAARRHDVVLVEDDYEADLALADEIPALKSLDADGRVIYVGSFSKVLAPGLRVGYVVAPRAVIARVARAAAADAAPPALEQSARHRDVRGARALPHASAPDRQRSGGARRPHRRSAAPPHAPFSWRRDPGATSFWMKGPAGLDARDLSLRARARGVLIEPGDIFFADPDAGRACFRLGFASIRTDRIEAGLTHLSETGQAGGTSRHRGWPSRSETACTTLVTRRYRAAGSTARDDPVRHRA